MNVVEIIAILCIIGGIIILVIGSRLVSHNDNFPKHTRKRNGKFAILIPARDESLVIEGLLRSIKNQTRKVDMQDVYVIVEDKNDPTVAITERLGAEIIVRKRLDLKRKGYALDEAIKAILSSKKHYDAYFIMDADNILDPSFLAHMEETYIEGHDLGIGYRNCKNGSENVIAACSILTFTLINASGNKTKNRQSRNVVISGTGFFIRGSLIEAWQGFPFHSLTEDYEMSLYAMEHNLTTFYNENAVFYDEQPVRYQQTVPQRIRWIRGFFDSRRNYIPRLRKQLTHWHTNWGSQLGEVIGINPYIMMVLGAGILILHHLYIFVTQFLFLDTLRLDSLITIAFILFIAYGIIAVMTAGLIIKEKDRLNLTPAMKCKAILFNPLFLATYIPCFMIALLKKEVTWDRINHTRTFIIKND